MRKILKKRCSGFTLIEMTVVLFIIALLILIIIPNINSARKNAESKNRAAMVSVVKTQISAYLNDHHDSNVSLGNLQADHYLSSDQARKVRDYHISVNHNQVR